MASVEGSCCSSKPAATISPAFLNDPKVYQIATLIVKIAVSVLALIVAPIPFLVAITAGVIVGSAYRYFTDNKMPEALELQPVCAKGYAEMLAQVQFPPLVNLGITTFSLSACIYCQTLFFAPFAGLLVGFYLGQLGVETASDLFATKETKIITTTSAL